MLVSVHVVCNQLKSTVLKEKKVTNKLLISKLCQVRVESSILEITLSHTAERSFIKIIDPDCDPDHNQT